MEEIGHFFDAEVNEVDTAGDEGELFSGLVREYDLSEAELTRIKAENDLNYVFFGNNLVVLETSEPIVLFVDTTVDENDGSADIGAGLSLRDAISIANESPDTPHIIKLESGVTYELTYISNQATGDRSLNTAGNITIESDGNDYAAIVHNNDVIPEGFASYIISNQGNSILNLNNIAISNQDGGGLYNNGTLTVDNSLINDNASRGIYNGGIYNRGDLTIDNSIISNNIPWGIYNPGDLTIDNSIISNNIPWGIESYGNLTVDNSLISNNTSSEFGGGIFILSGTSTLTNNTINNNTSDVFVGGIFILSGTSTLTNNTITGNTANFGGGISNWYWGNTLTLTNNTITGNTANRSGGGIYNQGEADLTNNTITGNTSSRLGGGIYNQGEADLTNNTITGNTSSRLGGGIYNQGEADLTNNTITGNTSSRLGGGIYNGGTWSSNSTISGNISNQAWYITPDGELTTSPGYNDYDPNTGESEFIEYNLHPTYPDIYDIGDTGSFTPLPPSPEPNPEPNPEPTPQPTISISDSWVEVETDTNETTL
ncbi:right-handed parallel beta-helix repeat-containing protein, partial [Crocosphaera watsonii]|uniref:right-handed parallel beta-helix repeat-containing protein n=1 Tax=Crocosphaera watsonii TaxID=263511 RepID=UPI000AF0E7CC